MIKEIKISIFLFLLFYTNFLYCQWAGSGTQNDPYQISTAAHLVALPNFVMADADETNNYLYKNTWNKFWKVMNDIDMNGVDYTPCGGWGNELTPQGTITFFTGTFDGNNKTIRNLTINKSGNGLVALFGFTIRATIKNVVLANMALSGTNFIGGIVGYAIDTNTISNCSFSGTIVASGGTNDICIGGIVGYSADENSITSCQSHGTITTNQVNTYSGGIVGYLYYSSMSECFSDATLINNGSGDFINIGGLVGRSFETSTVNRSYFLGTITHTGSGSGGIGGCIGLDGGGTHSNLYSKASITATNGSPNVGGLIGVVSGTTISHSYAACKQFNASGNKGLFIGKIDSNPAVTNSYYANNIAGNAIGSGSTGGITSKSIADLQTDAMISTLNAGQSAFPWKKDANNTNEGLPILSWQPVTAVTPYTVSFDSNGGAGTMSSQTFTQGISQNLSNNTFTRTGFTFASWNTVSNGSGTSYSNNQNISVTRNLTLYAQWNSVAIAPPTLTANVATAITQTTATLNGSITAGTETITERGFEWKLNSDIVWTKVPISGSTIPITHNLSGLAPDTQYNVRAYALTASGTTKSNEITFTTTVLHPVLTVHAVTNITQTTATLSGNIVAGSETITERGFEWKLNSGSAWTTVPDIGSTENITKDINGLTANIKYDVRAYVKIAGTSQYSNIVSFTTLETSVTSPTLIANAATSVTQTSATLNGEITAGSETITKRGFEWKLNSATTWTEVVITNTNSTISHTLTTLTAGTSYNFRVFVTAGSNTLYSTTVNFNTTVEAITAPVLSAITPTSITQTSATLNGNITEGSEAITERGFEWKLKSGTTWTKITIAGTATIIYNLTGLSANTTYSVRVYATTTSGTTNSTIRDFTTTNITTVTKPTVTSKAATNITTTTVVLNGTVIKGTEALIKKGFEWKLKSATTWTSVTITTTGNNITSNLTGLTAGTPYNFRTYATTASTTTYGSTLSFTTTSVVTPPTLTTDAATVITTTSATLNGTFKTGSQKITQQGFEWKLKSATTWTKVTVTGTATTISRSITGLKENTQYDFRIFTTTASGTTYGSTLGFTTTKNITSVNTENNTSITVYPNPTSSSISISGLEKYQEQEILLINISGQIVFTTIVKSPLINIDVSSFSKGFYVIKVGRYTQKLQVTL